MQRGWYNIFVEGEGLTETKQLVFASLDSSLLVQIEKPLYIPGELVKFRVFSFDSNTNAITPCKKCYVFIRNHNRILIENYRDIAFVKGKYEGTLLLGGKAPEGVWQLEAYCEVIFKEMKII